MAAVDFTIKWSNDLAKLIEEAGLKAPYAIAKALDEVGNKTATLVKRATAYQAGVHYSEVAGVLTVRQAMGAGNGEFVIIARDVTLSLRKFDARPGPLGVTAKPWRTARLFPRTFIGPNRQVYVRANTHARNSKPVHYSRVEKALQGEKVWRLPIKKLWGPNIPREMTRGQAEETFYRVTEQLLPFTLEKWLLK